MCCYWKKSKKILKFCRNGCLFLFISTRILLLDGEILVFDRCWREYSISTKRRWKVDAFLNKLSQHQSLSCGWEEGTIPPLEVHTIDYHLILRRFDQRWAFILGHLFAWRNWIRSSLCCCCCCCCCLDCRRLVRLRGSKWSSFYVEYLSWGIFSLCVSLSLSLK